VDVPQREQFDEATAGELFSLAYRVAFRLVGSRQDAEDVAQEAVARACASWRRIHDYPEAWVSKVSANMAIDVIRRRRRVRAHAERTRDGSPTTVEHEAERLDLAAAVQRLPRRQREVVVLRYIADLSVAVVAEQLGCSSGTVKQHASRGLDALRTHLGPAAWMEAP
jgi:RNA polymerase sigma-70 factor (sigma-E family)